MSASDVADLPDIWPQGESLPAVSGLNRAMRWGGGVLLGLILLSLVVPIGGAVIGEGQIGLESRVKRIAHPFGGVIAEIRVGNGEHVDKGQLLLRLDDQVTDADATYSSLTVDQLLAQKARLEAERLGAGSVQFPAELIAANTPSARKAMADERRLFDMRGVEERQLRTQLAARVVQLDQGIIGLRAQIDSMQQQKALIQPEREGVKQLWEKGLVTISRLNQMERTAAEMDGRIASLQSQIAQSRSQISETQERAVQLTQTRRVEAGSELARVMTALNEQQVRSVSAGDHQRRSDIRAPYAGTVEKIAFAAIGDVVRPAEPIMDIVPDADRMVVEASISPADIDQVRMGQTARVRFTTFNRADTPELYGKVSYVATDRSSNAEGNQSFFRVRIAVDQAQLKAERLDLRSGMPAEVHIHTGNRSMLSYITKPLRDQFARAFRDN
jgi:HlyD family type I secretion membrane fusion protein